MEQRKPITFSIKSALILVVLAILGFILVLITTSQYGAGLSPDSIGYIGTARNIISGAGIISYDGHPLVEQPPLFPLLLALVGKLSNSDPLMIVNIVNAFIFGLIVFFGGLLNLKYLPPPTLLAIFGALAVLFSIPLFKVSIMAWSEPLFILLVILSLHFANLYLEKRDAISLLLFTVSIVLSSLTRYIGIVLILWGALIIVFFNHDCLRNKIAHFSIFSFFTFFSIGLWLVRNYDISATLFGPRAPSVFTLPQNLMFVFNTLLAWYIPGMIADHRPTLILFGIILGFFVGLNPKVSWQSVNRRLRQFYPVLLFLILYTVFLVISSTITAYDRIGDRLLSPIFVHLTIFLLFLFQALAEPYQNRFSKKAVNLFLIITFASWLLVYPIRNTIINAVNLAPIGQGYSSKAWSESQTVDYLIQHPSLESDCSIYTNAPDVAYILAHLKTKSIPAKTYYNSIEPINDISQVKKIWAIEEKKICIVIFNKVNREYLFTIDELAMVSDIHQISVLDDGAIYSVIKR